MCADVIEGFPSGHPNNNPLILTDHLLSLVYNLFLLVLSMLFAVQIRAQVFIGPRLDETYQPHPFILYIILLVIGVFLHTLSLPARHIDFINKFLAPSHPYRRHVIMTLGIAISIALLLPDISTLQLIYFVIVSTVFGVFAIVVPMRIYAGYADLQKDLRALFESRYLIGIWLSTNLQTRYTQTILGIAWIVLLPLSTALILTFAFTQLLRFEMDVPFVSFFLAGLVPFSLFQTSVNRSAAVVMQNMGLISKAYFPREVLVVVQLSEVFVDFLISFGIMLVINALFGVFPNWRFIFLPIIIFILFNLTLGFMLVVSSLSVLIRDTPQLTGVVLQMLFYITPVIFPVNVFPERFQFLFAVNPMASIIIAFRDVIVYNQIPDWTTLYFPFALSWLLVFLGYSMFKQVEDVMADLS